MFTLIENIGARRNIPVNFFIKHCQFASEVVIFFYIKIIANLINYNFAFKLN